MVIMRDLVRGCNLAMQRSNIQSHRDLISQVIAVDGANFRGTN